MRERATCCTGAEAKILLWVETCWMRLKKEIQEIRVDSSVQFAFSFVWTMSMSMLVLYLRIFNTAPNSNQFGDKRVNYL